MASGGDELVKYITEKVVVYIESPRDQRKRDEVPRQPWSQKWFGMMPLGISIWRSKWSRNKKDSL
ncbi:YqzE family protein [Paenibacillus sp. sgz500958]|uniref:YqzE family protein n=1 Tax=Paenibacillus sp. sgz500958 TaxID=3242475 RepID=UPI0036D3EB10